ncbi:MAG: hypothetical protein ACRENP_26125 [Longimicrobiales bacterium]
MTRLRRGTTGALARARCAGARRYRSRARDAALALAGAGDAPGTADATRPMLHGRCYTADATRPMQADTSDATTSMQCYGVGNGCNVEVMWGRS